MTDPQPARATTPGRLAEAEEELAAAVTAYNRAAAELGTARARLLAASDSYAAARTPYPWHKDPLCGAPGGYTGHRHRHQPADPACLAVHTHNTKRRAAERRRAA